MCSDETDASMKSTFPADRSRPDEPFSTPLANCRTMTYAKLVLFRIF
jgi:hypothetical protein